MIIRSEQTKIEYLKNVAIKAGKAILEVYNTDFKVEYKDDASPLTLADKNANKIIVTALKEKYPDYSILSEESKDDQQRIDNDFCFIVDPLDGTKEFVKKNGEFTVNIALTFQKRVILGVIYVPVNEKIYYAIKGRGSYLEDLRQGIVTRLFVSDRLENLIWVNSRSHFSANAEYILEKYKDFIGEITSAGSSLKGCLIAEKKADIYYRFGLTHEWDTAAMQCIVEEAGGIFRQMDGSEMLYNRLNTLNEKGFYIVNRKENVWV